MSSSSRLARRNVISAKQPSSEGEGQRCVIKLNGCGIAEGTQARPPVGGDMSISNVFATRGAMSGNSRMYAGSANRPGTLAVSPPLIAGRPFAEGSLVDFGGQAAWREA